MIIVRIMGGLGNQMFQYAAARALANRLNMQLRLDLREFKKYKLHKYGLDSYLLDSKIATEEDLKEFPHWQLSLSKALKNIGINKKFYVEPSFHYSEAWEKLNGETYMYGYFQSEKYFNMSEGDIRKEFVLREEIADKNIRIINQCENSESVSVHVRRGDYITNQKVLEKHGICSLDYYKNAISLIRDKFQMPKFFVFSNDIKWAKENLNFGEDAVFVMGNENVPALDLHIMARCRHHIIANSSFSWWGAWLGDYSKKYVIAPTPWFDSKIVEKDLVPSSWVKIDKC